MLARRKRAFRTGRKVALPSTTPAGALQGPVLSGNRVYRPLILAWTYYGAMWLVVLCLFAIAPVSAANQQEAPAQLDAHSWKLDCAHLDFLKEGRPVFFGSMTEVRSGIATRKAVVTVGEPIIVDLWVDNRTEKPILSGGRCPPYLFRGDVFDSSGHRVIGVREQANLDAEKKGAATVEVCANTEILVEIPPHTCMVPVAAHADNFTLDYNLPPGTYYVFPGRGTDPALFKQGLVITVREPK
jgi:hypothetical protein